MEEALCHLVALNAGKMNFWGGVLLTKLGPKFNSAGESF
jgi:hypothetical protein